MSSRRASRSSSIVAPDSDARPESSLALVPVGSGTLEGPINVTSSSEVTNTNIGLYDQLRELMETELKCAICQQLINNAVNIDCSHTFCFNCLAQWRRTTSRCPICREIYTNRSRVLMIDNLIHRYCQLANIKVEKNSPISSPTVSSTDSTVTDDSWFNIMSWPEPRLQPPSVREVGVNTSPISRTSDSFSLDNDRRRNLDSLRPRDSRTVNNNNHHRINSNSSFSSRRSDNNNRRRNGGSRNSRRRRNRGRNNGRNNDQNRSLDSTANNSQLTSTHTSAARQERSNRRDRRANDGNNR